MARVTNSKEKSAKEKEKEKEMAPLCMFLSAALNVELVYVILESISKFSLLNFVKNGFTKKQMRDFQRMEYQVDRYGDTSITVRSYKIQNINDWQEKSGKDFFTCVHGSHEVTSKDLDKDINRSQEVETMITIKYH